MATYALISGLEARTEVAAPEQPGRSAGMALRTQPDLSTRATVVASTFATSGEATDDLTAAFVAGLCAEMERHGYRRDAVPGAETQVVLHVVDAAQPKPYRRKAAPTFVVA